MAAASRPSAQTQTDLDGVLDLELEQLPPELRWREWMGRVEAAIFASAEPLPREALARIVGRTCSIDLLIDDIRQELRGRPYDLVEVGGGWHHRTRKSFGPAIRIAAGMEPGDRTAVRNISQSEALILMCIAYYQPLTRAELSSFFGREVSREMIAALRAQGLVGAGPRSPQPGAPLTYVTTKGFLSQFGLKSLRDLPDFEALEDAGLLSKRSLMSTDMPGADWGEEASGEADE